MVSRLLQIRKGGDVKRFHTVTMLREHLVSSHSWGVATIILDVYPECSKELLIAALYHDVPEHIVGDMPATTKWRHPELADKLAQAEAQAVAEMGLEMILSPYEQKVLKFADMADLVLCCLQEVQLGNRTAAEVVARGIAYLEERFIDPKLSAYLAHIKHHATEVQNGSK